MNLLRRVRDLESKTMQGRCHHCGGPIRWLVSIEEREAMEERVAKGERHCEVCAEQMIYRAVAMPQDIIDGATNAKGPEA